MCIRDRDGELIVEIALDFVASVGDQFTLATFGEINGSFVTVSGLETIEGLELELRMDVDRIFIEVVSG